MSDNIFIPEMWEDKTSINIDKYALKSDLNNFHLKNTNINMNDHIIENIKIGGINDAVNKSFVENRISSVANQIPYMALIKESVFGSLSATKIIYKMIENPIFNGLKPENVLHFVRCSHNSKKVQLECTSRIISINNNKLNINIKIMNELDEPWDLTVMVYLYIIIVKSTVSSSSDLQNDQPSNEPSYEPVDSNHLTHNNSPDISRLYF